MASRLGDWPEDWVVLCNSWLDRDGALMMRLFLPYLPSLNLIRSVEGQGDGNSNGNGGYKEYGKGTEVTDGEMTEMYKTAPSRIIRDASCVKW